MFAVFKALEEVPGNLNVHIITDSKLASAGFAWDGDVKRQPRTNKAPQSLWHIF
jgi:hypothetical protein